MNSMIAAIADNLIIGRDNRLPWSLPEDLRRFKEITMGSTLIMGRKTFESLPGPLPGRRLIVISHGKPSLPSGVKVRHDLHNLLKQYKNTSEEVFIIGGASIYETAMPYCDKIYLTLILQYMSGDTYFPIHPDRLVQYGFVKSEESEIFTNEQNGLRYRFKTFLRKRPEEFETDSKKSI